MVQAMTECSCVAAEFLFSASRHSRKNLASWRSRNCILHAAAGK